MIIKINLETKSISFEGSTSILEFLTNLEKLIKKEEWDKWRIESNLSYYWWITPQPIVTPYIPDYPLTEYPITTICGYPVTVSNSPLNQDIVAVPSNTICATANSISEGSIVAVSNVSESLRFIEFK